MDENHISQHSPGETVTYHLLPGVVIIAGYILVAPFVRNAGLPLAFRWRCYSC
jgi:hypothetical protein